MMSLKSLLGCVATDAIPGGRMPDNHYDESKNEPVEEVPYRRGGQPSGPVMRFDLELIENPDGTQEWVK